MDNIKEQLKQDIYDVYKNNSKFTRNIYIEKGKYSRELIDKYFGSWTNMLNELNLKINRVAIDYYSNEEILEDICNIFKIYGYINKRLYEKHGKVSNSVIRKKFKSFTNAFKEAGITPNYMSYAYTNDELLDIARDIYEENGFISKKLLSKSTGIPNATLINRLGFLDDLYNSLNIDFFPVSEKFKIILQVVTEYLCESPILEWKHDKLINPKTGINLRIDAYFKENNIAIEFDGEQHFKYKPHYHKTYDKFLYRKYLDNLKNNIMENLNIPLIRFKYDDNLTNEFILSKIKQVVTK